MSSQPVPEKKNRGPRRPKAEVAVSAVRAFRLEDFDAFADQLRELAPRTFLHLLSVMQQEHTQQG